MWYRWALKKVKDNIILPGKTPLKPGYFRAWSGTTGDFDSIRKHGLSLDFSQGDKYNEPNLIWGSTGRWEDRHPSYISLPTVEFQISPEILKTAEHPPYDPNFDYEQFFSKPGIIALTESIPPEDIIEIYEPWMDIVLYLLESPEAFEYLEKIIENGEDLDEDYLKAYRFIKKHME